jgi:hypothetical protein
MTIARRIVLTLHKILVTEPAPDQRQLWDEDDEDKRGS